VHRYCSGTRHQFAFDDNDNNGSGNVYDQLRQCRQHNACGRRRDAEHDGNGCRISCREWRWHFDSLVTISSITGNGQIGISLAAGTASNACGNAGAVGPSDTFLISGYVKAVGARCPGSGEYVNSLATTTSLYQSTVGDHPCSSGTGTYYRAGNYNSDYGEWRPNLAYGGWYNVQETHGHGLLGNPVTYTIYYKGGGSVATALIQSNCDNMWNDLGEVEGTQTPYQFDSGQDTTNTRVHATPGATESTSHHRVYDACRWLWNHPNDVPNLTATPVSTTEIDLSWTGVDMPTGGAYKIERSTGDDSSFAQIYSQAGSGANPGTQNYSDTGLTLNTTYYYRVLASKTDDANNYSPEANAATWSGNPPTISIGSPSATLTNTGPVTYTITYGMATSITLAAGNVTLNKTGTANEQRQ